MKKRTDIIIAIALTSAFLCGCSETKTTNAYTGGGSDFSQESTDRSSSNDLEIGSVKSGSSSKIPDVPEESSSDSSSYSDIPDYSYDGSVYDENIYFALRDNEKKFAEASLFVGDSICKGLMTYNVLQPENVFATGSVATRNFFDTSFFYYGKDCTLTDVLYEREFENVLFSMGMNDVNMITPQQYCENYSKIISLVLNTTNADVFICAITPICCSFTSEGRIDSFNAEIKKYIEGHYKERVHFVDFTEPLKNKEGRLKSYFSGGDGIHLAPEAYYALFHELYSIISASDYFNKPKPPQSTQSSQSSKSSQSEQSTQSTQSSHSTQSSKSLQSSQSTQSSQSSHFSQSSSVPFEQSQPIQSEELSTSDNAPEEVPPDISEDVSQDARENAPEQ